MGDWVHRFTVHEGRVPNRLDFAKHQGFHKFRFIDPYANKWEGVVAKLDRAKEICTNHYDVKDWFITAEGTVWMASEEEILLFKLYW